MLETYVQMAYFDRIIGYANTRFMIMSSGQYELKRRLEAQKTVLYYIFLTILCCKTYFIRIFAMSNRKTLSINLKKKLYEENEICSS